MTPSPSRDSDPELLHGWDAARGGDERSMKLSAAVGGSGGQGFVWRGAARGAVGCVVAGEGNEAEVQRLDYWGCGDKCEVKVRCFVCLLV